jgi:hypothetical protein
VLDPVGGNEMQDGDWGPPDPGGVSPSIHGVRDGGGPEYASVAADGGIACVLIASAFDRDVLTWVADNWAVIDSASGRRWHLVIPIRQDAPRTGFKPEHFDTDAARNLARAFGIGRQAKPCIVIDTGNEEERQLRIILPSPAAELDQLFRAIDDYVASVCPDPDTPLKGQARRLFGQRLSAHLINRRYRKSAIRWVGKAATPATRLARLAWGQI